MGGWGTNLSEHEIVKVNLTCSKVLSQALIRIFIVLFKAPFNYRVEVTVTLCIFCVGNI